MVMRDPRGEEPSGGGSRADTFGRPRQIPGGRQPGRYKKGGNIGRDLGGRQIYLNGDRNCHLLGRVKEIPFRDLGSCAWGNRYIWRG